MHSTPSRRAPGELGFALLALAFSLLALWQAWLISGIQSLSAPGVFPMLAAATMLLSGLVILVGTLRKHAPDTSERSLLQQFAAEITPLRVVLLSALIVAYMFALESAGFLPSSYVFLVASMKLLGMRRTGLALLVAALSLGAIYLVFQTVFSVVLPKGVLLP